MPDHDLSSESAAAWGWTNTGQLRSVLAQHQYLILTCGFGIAAFLVYHFLGPPDTIYNNFVILGDAFLHGRIEIVQAPELPYIEFATVDDKSYIIPPPWPAILLLPAIIVFGTGISQTFISALLGGATGAVVYTVVRNLKSRVSTQVWLTALFLFGTVFFYTAADGGVWFFSHTVAVLFLFIAIYFTIVRRNPLLAGLCLGAAYWTRQPTILTLPFFLIMFSDEWLKPAAGRTLLQRIELKPLVMLGAGLGVFVLASFVYNYIRFGTPLDASQHHLPEDVLAQPWFNHGPFDPRYISRHVVVFFEAMPIVQKGAPYVLPSWAGMALWATTPAFFYALFNNVRDRLYIAAGVGLVLLATGIIVSQAVASYWDGGWTTYEFPRHINLVPFYALIGGAIWMSRHDKFALACWAAVIPTAIMLFTFGGTGFAQFGYRFALDFMPFLFLLTVKAMGDDLKWHHKALIVASVAVNLWGVLWIHQFHHSHFLDLQWVRF